MSGKIHIGFPYFKVMENEHGMRIDVDVEKWFRDKTNPESLDTSKFGEVMFIPRALMLNTTKGEGDE